MFPSNNLAATLPIRLSVLLLVTGLAVYSQSAPRTAHAAPPISPDVSLALSRIRPENLLGNLSFLSSDLLAGRYTPSAGLDIAAEFIASQFRSAGLKPAGDREYFQVASMIDRKMPKVTAGMKMREGEEEFAIPAASVALIASSAALTVAKCPVAILKEQKTAVLRGSDVAGKVVVVPAIEFERLPEAERASAYSEMRLFRKEIGHSNAKALLLVGRLRRSQSGSLIPESTGKDTRVPVVQADSEQLLKWFAQPNTEANRTVDLNLPAPEDRRVELKNVIAVLPGSDPKLKDTYVLLTAHYDHIGTSETGKDLSMVRDAKPVDHIYNGANDDGSGTVSVIEIAKALAKLKQRPKRSIVFMTFFGEERGDIGSGYYGEHPVFPIAKTIADLNLEQVGRTDSTTGKKINNASVTGYDYSDVTKYLERAGRLTGVRVYMEKPASDDYFVRSDNAALAEKGVPAHTLCVAFDYPDYHGLGDEWQKVDYDNMARVDRMVALSLVNIANSPVAPKWNSGNAKTAPFREAAAKLKP